MENRLGIDSGKRGGDDSRDIYAGIKKYPCFARYYHLGKLGKDYLEFLCIISYTSM